MSETAEAPKKKKSPLPVVLALVLVLAAGGFFMMKGKSSEPKEDKSIIKLASEEIELEEFLVNMADRSTYLRAKISIKTAEGFDKHELEHSMGAIQDAIIRTLRTTSPDDVATDEQIVALKRKLAGAMNKVLGAHGGGGHDEGGHGKTTQIRRKVHEDELPPDWDSAEGPVLQVFFKAFATQ